MTVIAGTDEAKIELFGIDCFVGEECVATKAAQIKTTRKFQKQNKSIKEKHTNTQKTLIHL